MSVQVTVQTISDDEPSDDDEDMHVDDQSSKKRKITGAAAHMCLKRAEGKRDRLTMEQKAELSVFAADHSHLSREAVINWALKEFDLKEAPAPALITMLKKDQQQDSVDECNSFYRMDQKFQQTDENKIRRGLHKESLVVAR